LPDAARWMNANITGWRALTPNEKKAIRDFAVLWPFFELNSTGQYGRPNATPLNIMRAVGDLPREPNLDRLELMRQHFAERYIDGERYTPHWSHLRMHENNFEVTRAGLVGADRTGRDTLTALLLVANRLRNNSFHGEKAQYEFAGQYSNFRNANSVLMYALELWPPQ